MVIIIGPLLYTITLSILSSALVVDAVYDKQTGAIRLLRLSNVGGTLYWLSIFAVHFVTYWLPVIVAFIIFCNVWITSFVAQTSLTAFTFVLHSFLFALVMTILVYCSSVLFVKVSTAMSTVLIVSLLLAITAGLIAGVLGLLIMFDLMGGVPLAQSKYPKATEALSVILPWWGYAGGLVGLGMNYAAQSVFNLNSTIWQPNAWSGFYVSGFIGLILWLLIATWLLIVIECVSSGVIQSLLARLFFRKSTNARMREQLELDNQPRKLFAVDENTNEDDDVRAERMLASQAASVLAEQATFTDTEA